ncbi:MAG TPA: hypothetical protein VE755_03220, partial [Myxococcales bacterium]|nr:hypothetical protein [Myxococcales bacterium]
VVFDSAPPYRVRRTATFGEDALAQTVLAAEQRLRRRLDEWPRPHLVDFGIDGFAAQAPGAQHMALWFESADLFARRGEILRAIDARLRLDPYATLDVVLSPEAVFPLDLVDAIRRRLDDAPASYVSRALAHRGEDLQRRIAVVLREPQPADWIDALRERVQVFRDQSAREALCGAERLGADLPGARVCGTVSDDAFADLARRADGDCVAFADPSLELAWTQRVLGFGDAR